MAVHSLHAPGMMVEHMIEKKHGENPSKNRINCSPSTSDQKFLFRQQTLQTKRVRQVRLKNMNFQSSKYEPSKLKI